MCNTSLESENNGRESGESRKPCLSVHYVDFNAFTIKVRIHVHSKFSDMNKHDKPRLPPTLFTGSMVTKLETKLITLI